MVATPKGRGGEERRGEGRGGKGSKEGRNEEYRGEFSILAMCARGCITSVIHSQRPQYKAWT